MFFQETGNDQQNHYASSVSRSSSLSSLSSSSDFPPDSGPYGNQVISGLKELEISLSGQLAKDMKTCFRQTESLNQQETTQFWEESTSSSGNGEFATKVSTSFLGLRVTRRKLRFTGASDRPTNDINTSMCNKTWPEKRSKTIRSQRRRKAKEASRERPPSS